MKPILAWYHLSFLLVAISVIQCRSEEVPVVSTSEITSITISSASSGGNILSDGGVKILSKGVCWKTALERWSLPLEPTIDDQKSIDGNGSDGFASQLTRLDPGTTYYVRAYAINKYGIGYGSEKTFRTLGDLPSASEGQAKNVTAFTATLEGFVDPKRIPSDVIFEYGLTPEYGQKIEAIQGRISGESLASVTAFLSNLSPATTYHFRISARNALGLIHSEDKTFKTSETVTDIDGFNYEVVTIGNQQWLKENLKTTRFLDGTVIPLVSSDSRWSDCVTGAYTSYNNNNSNVTLFGVLYNWYAVNDKRGLCPAGWHVPTNNEFSSLVNHLGGVEIAGGKLKKIETTHWDHPNTGADNSSQLSLIGSGFRDQTGAFSEIDKVAYLWSSDEYSPTHGIARKIYYNSESISFSGNYKQCGFSVRCIKDQFPRELKQGTMAPSEQTQK